DVHKRSMSIEEARQLGAMALFGEKYGDTVRVVSMGSAAEQADFSIEPCGGTHVRRTGDIGLFRVVQESGIAAGVRRIEAVTGKRALARVREQEQVLATLAATLKASTDNLVEKVQQLAASNRSLEKDLQQLKARLASARGDELLASAQEIQGIKVLVSEVEGLDSKG